MHCHGLWSIVTSLPSFLPLFLPPSLPPSLPPFSEDDVFDEAIAELEEDLAIASMWAYEESDEEEGEEGAGAAATKAKSSLRSVNRIGGTQKGILTVEGLGLGGYSSKV